MSLQINIPYTTIDLGKQIFVFTKLSCHYNCKHYLRDQMKDWYVLMLRNKGAEMWCGDLHQLRKFLFFSDQQQLGARERLYILVRMENRVESSEYC